MSPPELIQSSAPHFVAVDEGSRDAKGRKSYVTEDERQQAVNSDEMADVMDAANRKKVSFAADAEPQAQTEKSISPYVEITQATVSESADQEQIESPPAQPRFQIAQPLFIHTPTAEIPIKATRSSVAKIKPPRHPEPDQDIAARLETLKAQNDAVRTSLDAFDSQSVVQARTL